MKVAHSGSGLGMEPGKGVSRMGPQAFLCFVSRRELCDALHRNTALHCKHCHLVCWHCSYYHFYYRKRIGTMPTGILKERASKLTL